MQYLLKLFAVNLLMTLFLPVETWGRLLVWLAAGLVFYFLYGRFHSVLASHLRTQLAMEGVGPTNAPLNTAEQTRDERLGGGGP